MAAEERDYSPAQRRSSSEYSGAIPDSMTGAGGFWAPRRPSDTTASPFKRGILPAPPPRRTRPRTGELLSGIGTRLTTNRLGGDVGDGLVLVPDRGEPHHDGTLPGARPYVASGAAYARLDRQLHPPKF